MQPPLPCGLFSATPKVIVGLAYLTDILASSLVDEIKGAISDRLPPALFTLGRPLLSEKIQQIREPKFGSDRSDSLRFCLYN
jgi:hypothetical protein